MLEKNDPSSSSFPLHSVQQTPKMARFAATTCTPAPSKKWSSAPLKNQAFPSASPHTLFATPLPPTCSKLGMTFVPYKNYLVTKTSRPPAFSLTSLTGILKLYVVHWIARNNIPNPETTGLFYRHPLSLCDYKGTKDQVIIREFLFISTYFTPTPK
jgi:hypothetical protein